MAPEEERAVPLLQSSIRIGGYEVHALEARGRRSCGTSGDGVLVTPFGVGVRTVVLDGVTPLPETPAWMGLDGAVTGMSIVRAALLQPDSPEVCLQRANRELHRPDLPGRAQPQATVLVADIDDQGNARLIRGCDTEAWLLDDVGDWHCLFPVAPRSWASEAWRRVLAEEPGLRTDSLARWRRESLVWDRREAWESHPIGRFADPRLEVRDVESAAWRALLLATDGAGTREEGAASVDRLADALRVMDGEVADGDQAVLLIDRAAG